MKEDPNINESMSFEELYNAYYSFQVKNNGVPLLDSYCKIQEGVAKILGESFFKKLKGGSNLFLQENNATFLPVPFNKAREQFEDYKKEFSNKSDFVKGVILNKIKNYTLSKNFEINLNISYPQNFSSTSEGFSDLCLYFDKIDSERALGLHYALNDVVPRTEFFKTKYGFALKISELSEVKNKISEIRTNYGIVTPRDLVRTISEKGRKEEGKKASKLNYAVNGEREIFDFLNGYIKLNFGFAADSLQGIFTKLKRDDNSEMGVGNALEYQNLIVEKGNREKRIKNKWGEIWTGKIHVSHKKFIREDEIISLDQNNFGKVSGQYLDNGLSHEFVEFFCANCIQKFAEKGLAKKLKIGISKKYY